MKLTRLDANEKNAVKTLIELMPNTDKDLLLTIVDFVIEETLVMSVFISYLETKAYNNEGKNMVRIKFYLDPSIERVVFFNKGIINALVDDLEGYFNGKFCNEAIKVTVKDRDVFEITISLDTVLIPQ